MGDKDLLCGGKRDDKLTGGAQRFDAGEGDSGTNERPGATAMMNPFMRPPRYGPFHESVCTGVILLW